MKYIALTGGIGSGKSTVARLLAQRGIPIYDADAAAKRLMTTDPALRAALGAQFGPEAFLPSGELNRAHLAARVFSDPAALAALNALVHPAVAADSRAWFELQRAQAQALPPQQRPPFAVHEAAIVFEHGYQTRYDAVVLVAAPEALRLARAQARDAAPEAAVRARMARQWTEAQTRPLAQFVIENDGRPLEPQLEALIAHFAQA